MINKKITIIGMGTMGRAIAHALINNKTISPANLRLSTPNILKITGFEHKNVQIFSDNSKAIQDTDIIILCIKPQISGIVLNEISKSIYKNQLIISIMAGTTIATMENIVGKTAIIRSMPNLCASIGQGMTGWVKNSLVTPEQTKNAQTIFSSFGKEIQVLEENQLNAVTAISGSGPAFIFYLAEVLTCAAIELGFDTSVADTLVRQTMKGSIQLLQSGTDTPDVLRKKVTSKGGTTEAAFNVLFQKNVARMIIDSVTAARNRAEELSI